MGPGTDIIIFSLSRYDDPISSVGFSYAKEFAKQGRVFFIEHPFTWKDVFTEGSSSAIQKRKRLWSDDLLYLKDPTIPGNITYVVPPRMIPVNFLPEGTLYEGLCKQNDDNMIRLLEKLIMDQGITDFIFFNVFNPFYLNEFPDRIKPYCKAYLSLDDMSQVEYTARHGVRREGTIMASWDLAFATGKALSKKLSASGHTVHHLPNAADFEVFHQAYAQVLTKPDELSSYGDRKMIGYTGSIEYRMDLKLLDMIAEHHPDKLIVLIGPISDKAKETLVQRENILLLGPEPLEALPAYLQRFDVMIIPFLCNTLTASIYPLKLNEYLAAGKAVVATNFSEDLQDFCDVVYIAGTHEVFLAKINTALSEDHAAKRDARVQKARQNTWTSRVAQFWELMW